MPYFIYRIMPGETPAAKTLEYVEEHAAYRDAKGVVKKMRMGQAADKQSQLKIIFAEDRSHAEQQLLEHREEPILREWEK